jgi:hypothetical protein
VIYHKTYYSLCSNYPGCRTNVFVYSDAPQYPALMAWKDSPENVDERDWKLDDKGRPGIHVSLTIFQQFGSSVRMRPSHWKTPGDAEIKKSLARLARGDRTMPSEEFGE